MIQTIAGLLTERYPPEKPKFKAPLLFIHGLWTGSWCWTTWATHFCNLGWDCWALNFHGRVEPAEEKILRRLSFSDCVDDLIEFVDCFPSSPVVIAHDVGALIALKTTSIKSISALILAAPAVPRSAQAVRSPMLRLLRLKYLWLIYLGRPFLPQEKDRHKLLAPLPESLQAKISDEMVPESPHLIAELFSCAVNTDSSFPSCPSLILAGTQDAVIPPTSGRLLAQRLGSDYREHPDQGHWIIESRAEPIVREIHRWLVQKLGAEILLAEFV
jgi:pimeloyl-ACP methyl ester carboxylesterase